jgi:sulfane dehydrogenase subunit SoxC
MAPVVRVEVGIDGDWQNADLDAPVGEYAWRRWACRRDLEIGEHVLSCRATDAAGNAQPIDQPWNWQGMGNNAVQTVMIDVR